MKTKALLCAATLAATVGLATDAMAAVGDPTGTQFGISGKNYGSDGAGGYDFGLGMNFQDNNDGLWTEDLQLDGTGTAVPVTFGGPAQTINGLEISETYQVWDPSSNPTLLGHNDAAGVTAPGIPLPFLNDGPAYNIEIKIRDTAGTVNDGGGVNRNIFDSSIIRLDNIQPDATTPSGTPAIPYFYASDRHPREVDPMTGLDGNAVGFYWYYEKNGVPANPAADLNLPVGILQGDHPTKGASQQIYYGVLSIDQMDVAITHDITNGSFGFNIDTDRELQPGANLVNLADNLSFADSFSDFDTVVMGLFYRMVAAGDGNLDGKVDGLDYLRWASNYSTNPTNDPLPESNGGMAAIQAAPSADGTKAGNDGSLDFHRYYGDYNNDGTVDGLDYLVWASNYGFDGTGASQLAAAVPEPASIMLVFAALAGLGLVRRRR